MRISVISFTAGGDRLADKLKNMPGHIMECSTADDLPDMGGLAGWCETSFRRSDALIFIGACGIAVRSIAPFLVSKATDPAVVVMDEKANHVISLLSGHIGGANELTKEIAAFTGAVPVITTSSDINSRLAVDVWAKKNEFEIENLQIAKKIEADIIDGKKIRVFSDEVLTGKIPAEFVTDDDADISEYAINISGYDNRIPGFVDENKVLNLTCREFILGIGCKKGIETDELRAFVSEQLDKLHIKKNAVAMITSIDLKINEKCLVDLAHEFEVPFVTYSKTRLNALGGGYSSSDFVEQTTGVDCVCERAAVAGCYDGFVDFISRKVTGKGVTMAVAVRRWEDLV